MLGKLGKQAQAGKTKIRQSTFSTGVLLTDYQPATIVQDSLNRSASILGALVFLGAQEMELQETEVDVHPRVRRHFLLFWKSAGP